MSDLILDIKNITKSFPKVIANNKVTFGIKKNSVHAILGENGAGKSTFVKILYGLLEPDEGSIVYNSKPFEINVPFGQVQTYKTQPMSKKTKVPLRLAGLFNSAFTSG